MNKQIVKRMKSGFSLVDFLIALTILTFLITATAQLIIHSFFIKRRAEINLNIAELAAEKFEYFKSLSFENDELKECEKCETLTGKETGIYLRKWIIRNISTNLKRIEVEICPQEHPEKKAIFVLLLSRELDF